MRCPTTTEVVATSQCTHYFCCQARQRAQEEFASRSSFVKSMMRKETNLLKKSSKKKVQPSPETLALRKETLALRLKEQRLQDAAKRGESKHHAGRSEAQDGHGTHWGTHRLPTGHPPPLPSHGEVAPFTGGTASTPASPLHPVSASMSSPSHDEIVIESLDQDLKP